MSICPICGAEVTPRSANKAFPFCTARCKSIDLGKWLNEDYRVPGDARRGRRGRRGRRQQPARRSPRNQICDTEEDASLPGLASRSRLTALRSLLASRRLGRAQDVDAAAGHRAAAADGSERARLAGGDPNAPGSGQARAGAGDQAKLDEAEQEDSGRNFELVWVDGYLGGSYINMRQFSSTTLQLEKASSGGPHGRARRGPSPRRLRPRRARQVQRALGVQHVAAQRRGRVQDPDRQASTSSSARTAATRSSAASAKAPSPTGTSAHAHQHRRREDPRLQRRPRLRARLLRQPNVLDRRRLLRRFPLPEPPARRQARRPHARAVGPPRQPIRSTSSPAPARGLAARRRAPPRRSTSVCRPGSRGGVHAAR